MKCSLWLRTSFKKSMHLFIWKADWHNVRERGGERPFLAHSFPQRALLATAGSGGSQEREIAPWSPTWVDQAWTPTRCLLLSLLSQQSPPEAEQVGCELVPHGTSGGFTLFATLVAPALCFTWVIILTLVPKYLQSKTYYTYYDRNFHYIFILAALTSYLLWKYSNCHLQCFEDTTWKLKRLVMVDPAKLLSVA